LIFGDQQGRLLVGMGTALRLYDMGKKKLLRKSENKNFYNIITRLHVDGNRIVVGDAVESFVFCKYRRVSLAFQMCFFIATIFILFFQKKRTKMKESNEIYVTPIIIVTQTKSLSLFFSS
jgi:hypothetical protein